MFKNQEYKQAKNMAKENILYLGVVLCTCASVIRGQENGEQPVEDSTGNERQLVRPSPFQQQTQCPPFLCRNYCVNGRERDANGCDTCRCLSGGLNEGRQQGSGCPESQCKNFCFLGRQKDDRGCDTCRCNSAQPERDSFGPRQNFCPQLRCRNFCFGEREKDANGCDLCRCKSQRGGNGVGRFSQFRNVFQPVQFRCPQLRCANYCPSGIWAVDQNLCPTCNCIFF